MHIVQVGFQFFRMGAGAAQSILLLLGVGVLGLALVRLLGTQGRVGECVRGAGMGCAALGAAWPCIGGAVSVFPIAGCSHFAEIPRDYYTSPPVLVPSEVTTSH